MLGPLFISISFWTVVMTFGWWIQSRRKNASHVDVLWALGTGSMSIFWANFYFGNDIRQLVVIGLSCFWATRLGFYLFKDRVWRKPEDSRYADFRNKWGQQASRNFFFVFIFQALLIILFSLAFIPALSNSSPFPTRFDLHGIFIWLIAIIGESIADSQLSNFLSKKENQGKICKQGLWRYSRHPNYFFEWLHWFAYVFLAIPSDNWPYAFWGPIIMFIFLFKVTGIPIIEERSVQKRGEAYRQYQRETSMFIPWFYKKESS